MITLQSVLPSNQPVVHVQVTNQVEIRNCRGCISCCNSSRVNERTLQAKILNSKVAHMYHAPYLQLEVSWSWSLTNSQNFKHEYFEYLTLDTNSRMVVVVPPFQTSSREHNLHLAFSFPRTPLKTLQTGDRKPSPSIFALFLVIQEAPWG